MSGYENKFKVRLIPMTAMASGNPSDIRQAQVAFDVTPTFSEGGSVEYTQSTPTHMPGAIMTYKNTGARTFEIGAKLISRNVDDAMRNMMYLQTLRGWRMPYFGETGTSSSGAESRASTSRSPGDMLTSFISSLSIDALMCRRVQTEGVQMRGAPPDVLYLYAYSTAANDGRGIGPRVNLNRIPVVMTSLRITYPDDVDYIPVHPPGTPTTETAEPFARRIDVSVSLTETHSPRELERFDLTSYKLGNLANF